MKKIYLLIIATVISISVVFSADLTGVKIYINPGHGGYNGANDRNVLTIPFAEGDTLGFWESYSNLRKGLALKKRLEESNATVIMSRTLNREEDDRPLSEIAEEANANNVDAFLSIHSNAANSQVNYLLLLFHGADNEPTIPESKVQATASWPKLIDNQLTVWTHYQTSTNIRGDFTFYGNTSGLGVLRPLTVPGFLSEGSFHDYRPETHRLLNEDYRVLEAERFYRFYCEYFNADLPKTGIISGWVKGKDQRLNHPQYGYKAATDDQWLPLNGAQVKLMDEAGAGLAEYTVDTLYNGIYAFHDLAPGTYKLRFTAANHNTKDTTVVVKAATESAVKILMFNPDLPLYKEIPPDYPNPSQEAGVIPMSRYNFEEINKANPDWLNGAAIRKVAYNKDKLYVLTEEPKIHIVNASTFDYVKEMDITGVEGGAKILSDINFTADGYLLAINKDTISLPETKGRYLKVYTWDNDDAAPSLLFQTQYQGNWSNGIVGETFAVSGPRWKNYIYVPSVTTGSSKAIRIVGLQYEDKQQLGYKYMLDAANYTEAKWGEKFRFTISPTSAEHLFVDGEKIIPGEYQFQWSKPDRDPLTLKGLFAEKSGYELQPAAHGFNFFKNAGNTFMAAPNSNADGKSVGVVLFDITEGINNAKKVSEFLPIADPEPMPTKRKERRALARKAAAMAEMPAPYMFAAGFASGYDLTLIGLAEREGIKRFKTVASSNANVYASELRAQPVVGGYKLNFTLNYPVESGRVDILDGTEVVKTFDFGSMDKGQQSMDITLDGLNSGGYTWAVTVNAAPVDRPYKFTDNSWTQLQFYSPRGVAVDNSFESPYFGRVYASEQAGGKVTNRTTTDGIYMLNSALEDVAWQGDDAYHGNIEWAGTNSPFRLAVAPDGKVYLTDWSSANSGVWVMDPGNPYATFKPVFSGTRDANGLVSNNGVNVHGRISHAWVTGTGDDTKLFTFDRDYVDGTVTNTGNLLQYNIGKLETPWTSAPSAVIYDDGLNGNLQLNFNSSIAPDGRGGWWISQYRAADAASIPSLIHVNSKGMVDFNSGKTPTLIGNSYTGGMAITEDGSRIAMGANNEAKIYDVTFGADGVPTLVQKYLIKPAMGQHSAGLAFDKAGNIYVISNSSERLGVWALPKSENTFTTPASSIQMLFVIGTGIDNAETVESISVYPNPATDFIKINTGSSILKSATIFDLNGRVIRKEKVNGSESEINISDLVSGTYVLRVQTNKGVENKRIVKK